ncbi:unnamed protein product [Spodoptera littoralis]|uniref:Putative nuclease HARBI1 n=1 Tax=Spodoptera littoralis TaxID=7109 RepID=A0A9P0IDK7_SPOLI|nr:unnamed protein product [Spodoptera littoralis]CAH1645625.1 unnamed protein product [Spodoptera littoralis]
MPQARTRQYQTLVGQSVSQTTVSRAVRQVTEALNSILLQYVIWPKDVQDRNKIKRQFYKFGIPGVLGCIDGTHIAILRPVEHEERFFNRKGYHSLNVMIICDAELNILYVDASSPGSAHDSSVWQSSPIWNHMRELCNAGEHVFLLGDSGYPLRTNMMTPILNTVEGTPEHHFYQLHVTARNTVERCIGVLKARFRCLLAARALHYDPITAGKIVNACCVLHNIANKNRLPVPHLTPEEAFAERQRQHQIEREISVASAQGLELEPNHRVNPDLHRGRLLQRALVERLWRDHTNN